MNESNWALKNRRGLYAHPSWCEKAAKKKQKDRATDAAGSETKSVVGCLVDFLLASTTMIIRPKGIAVYLHTVHHFFLDFGMRQKILFCCVMNQLKTRKSHITFHQCNK